MKFVILIVLGISFFISCSTSSVLEKKAENKNAETQKPLVQFVIEAYNNHNLDKFRKKYSEEMLKSLSLEDDKKFFKKLKEKKGKIVKTISVEESKTEDNTLLKLIYKVEKGVISVNMTLNFKREIIAYYIFPFKDDYFEKYKTLQKLKLKFNQAKFEEIYPWYENILKNVFSLKQSNNFFKSIKEEHGKILKAEVLRKEKSLWVFSLKFKNTVKILKLHFSKSNKIDGLFISTQIDTVKYPKLTKKTKIQELIAAYLESNLGIGVSIATIKNGKTNFYYSGHKSKKTKEKIDENSIFEIGSITKTFTGAIILQLVEEKKLALDDKLKDYIKGMKVPRFPNSDKDITIKDILSHHSSLPRMPTNFVKYLKDNANPYAYYNKKALKEFMDSYTLKREVGTKYEYSNLGISLLTLVIEEITKKTYEEVLKIRIFKALDMNNSHLNLSESIKKDIAIPNNSPDTETKVWTLNIFNSAGAIKSTIGDMAKYLEANINSESSKVFPKELYKAVKNSNKNTKVALTWFIKNNNATKYYTHTGLTGGSMAHIVFDKDRKIGIVIMSNSNLSIIPLAKKIMKLLNFK